MSADLTPGLLGKLAALRVELTEQAFELERQGSVEAADITMIIKARLDEICGVIPVEFPRSSVRPVAVASSE